MNKGMTLEEWVKQWIHREGFKIAVVTEFPNLIIRITHPTDDDCWAHFKIVRDETFLMEWKEGDESGLG